MKVLIVLLAFIGIAMSAPQGGAFNVQPFIPLQPTPFAGEVPLEPSAPAQYDFQYEVNEPFHGNHYGHAEVRDGAYTQGSYYVQLPDSRVMKVDYYADEFGYHPTVTYEGEAVHPVSQNGILPQSGTAIVPSTGRISAPAPLRVPNRLSNLTPAAGPQEPLTGFGAVSPAPFPSFRFTQPNFSSGLLPPQRFADFVPNRLFSLPAPHQEI